MRYRRMKYPRRSDSKHLCLAGLMYEYVCRDYYTLKMATSYYIQVRAMQTPGGIRTVTPRVTCFAKRR